MNTLRANWLKKTLNRLFEYLDETFYINEGGCCFVAYVLAKRLEYIGEEFKLVLYDNDLEFTNSSEVKESIENRDTQSAEWLSYLLSLCYNDRKHRNIKSFRF